MMHVVDAVLNSFSFGNRNRIERWFRELKNRTEVLQQRKCEDIEEHRRVGNCNCNNA
jgi:hypothetical protein